MFLETLRRLLNISESWCPGQDSIQVPPQYKSEALALNPAFSVLFPCYVYVTVYFFFFITDCQCTDEVQSKCPPHHGKYCLILLYVLIKQVFSAFIILTLRGQHPCPTAIRSHDFSARAIFRSYVRRPRDCYDQFVKLHFSLTLASIVFTNLFTTGYF
jgi:hypothetical protein